jgi:hypothetical protein
VKINLNGAKANSIIKLCAEIHTEFIAVYDQWKPSNGIISPYILGPIIIRTSFDVQESPPYEITELSINVQMAELVWPVCG